MTPTARTPEPQPVVAAVVTSGLGVLAGRRRDGNPPWTFIAGEIDQGESPYDAAVREVKEETGCQVEPGAILGRRIHPATGRTMIYVAAAPVHGTAVIVGDEDELAEVRWLSLAEAGELMPGMFGPVRDYLAAALRPGADPRPDAYETLCAAWESLLQAIRDMPDPEEAYRAADSLQREVRATGAVLRKLRADMAHRIWQQRELSLSALGEVIGTGKARADQLIRFAQGRKTPFSDGERDPDG